jgi:hypothetical protein
MRQLSLALVGLSLVFVPSGAEPQSLTYSRGQNVAPAYEGWEQAPDGTRYFLFGYMNRNWEEEIDVPVGPDNGFNVGDLDHGQPTHFLPRRNRFVFRVPVPAGFTDKDELIWWVAPEMPADGKLTVQASFSEPGTYVLRRLADDGALTGYDEVTVVVVR